MNQEINQHIKKDINDNHNNILVRYLIRFQLKTFNKNGTDNFDNNGTFKRDINQIQEQKKYNYWNETDTNKKNFKRW